MTTTIDHAIQIPAATGVVWVQVSNPDFFPRWQVDCKRITYLTTQRKGKGTRMRCVGASGKEYVLEITAWYEGLGFEYRLVDGSAYEENRGRIRLQETAEGTIVQWTFTYALRGVFGSLRNTMGMKRTIELQITDSLKNFYRYIKDTAGEESIKLVKAMMQESPSVEQRANYKPRHPSRYEETRRKDKITTGTMRSVNQGTFRPIIDEPLPAEDDTRPNPATQTDDHAAIVPPTAMPANPAPTPPASPVLPAPPPGTVIPVTPMSATFPPEAASGKSNVIPLPPDLSEVVAAPAHKPESPNQPQPPRSEPGQPAAVLPPAPVKSPLETTESKPPSAPSSEAPAEMLPAAGSGKTDPSRMSVFEIFGLQKPSETQQMRAVQLAKEIRDQLTAPTQERLNPVATVTSLYNDEEKAERAAFMANMPSAADLDVQPTEVMRSGLRSRMRQNLLALRRPKKR